MPISGNGWEILLQRAEEQTKPSGRRRTVGTYQVYHDGSAQTARDLSGQFAETRGPGDNSTPGNNRRIEAGTYSLRTQGGTKYVTHGYVDSNMTNVIPRPGIELRGCAPRKEILIHPGRGFLSSIGCINLCTNLPDYREPITFKSSRRRVISVINDINRYLDGDFPTRNERPVPRAVVVIEGEP